MNEIETRRWLEEGYYITKNLESIAKQIQRAKERAMNTAMRYNRIGTPTSNNNATELKLLGIVELEEKYKAYAKKLQDDLNEKADWIDKLPQDLQPVLRYRYICGYSVRQTAKELYWSEAGVKKKTSIGIKKLSEIIPK